MKIVIEVESGCVRSVYTDAGKDAPQVFVVDLDGAKVGDETKAEQIDVEPIDDASDIVLEALP